MKNKLLSIALMGLLSLGAEVSAQATDVDCGGCVDTSDLAGKSVTNSKIGADSVSTGKISNGAVTSEKIASGAITKSKLADDAVKGSHIRAKAISSSKIAPGAVNENKIAEGAVTLDKLDPSLAESAASLSGFAYSASDISQAVLSQSSSSADTISTVTITVPGPGFIKADFSAYMTLSHTMNEYDAVVCSLKTSETNVESTTDRLVGSRRYADVRASDTTSSYYWHMDTQGVVTVGAAGTYSIYLRCYEVGATSTAVFIFRSLTAEYFSTGM